MRPDPHARGPIIAIEVDPEGGEPREVRALTDADRCAWIAADPRRATLLRRLAYADAAITRSYRTIANVAPAPVVDDIEAFADALDELIARFAWTADRAHLRARRRRSKVTA